MARKKADNKHKELDQSVEDDTTRAARVAEETSSDGKFSTYERVKVPGGELILQYRGEPQEK